MSENINYIISATGLIIASILFSMILLGKKKIKITKKKTITLITGIAIYILITKYTPDTFKTLLIFAFHTIQFKKMYKITYTQSIFMSFLFILLSIIADIILLFYLVIAVKISPELCYEEFTGSLIGSIFGSIIVVIIALVLRKILRRMINIKLNNYKKILVYTILTLASILIIFYTVVDEILLKENVILSIGIMLVFVIILYSLIRQKMENDKIVEKYDKLLEFIKKYEIIIEEQREARHESKNQLITIKSKVLNKDKEQEIIKYVDSILKDHIGYQEDKYGKFQYLPANGIKGLFYYKSMEAEEKGINLSINIGKRVENSIISKLDTEEFKQLGRILGVYLDNAIEASSISEEKKLGIEVYMHKKDVVIIISNTYKGEINEEKIGKVKYSTKGTNHGYGLVLVNKILSKNNRFHSERQVTNKIYIQKLTIKKSI